MRRLSSIEIERALSAILPNSLNEGNTGVNKLYNLSNLHETANYDLARGMLNHSTYCLVESINTTKSTTEQSKVTPVNLDDIVLTFSLEAYRRSKDNDHLGDIIFSIPPFSFAYPLLLSYHLILNHLSQNLINENKYKFSSDSGILIITDNIELLSHIWRTSINQNYLREFVPIYTLEAGKFKSFNFNGYSDKSKRNKVVDGSLPWLTLFRAYRTKLPEEFELQPEVIIIDLLPSRHRKRAETLINWAKDHSKHVIVIAPSHDKILQNIGDSFVNHFPIDKFSINQLGSVFNIYEGGKTNPITASWTTQSSFPYLFLQKKELKIIKAKMLNNEFYNTISLINEIMKKAKTRKGVPLSFKKLQQLFFKMLNICIPLEWYERTRWINNEPSFLELMNRWSRIPPSDKEEEIICETLLPHLYQYIKKIYELISELKVNVRGQLLLKVLEKVDSNKTVTIIVSDSIDQSEMMIWLKSSNSIGRGMVDAITVISQKEWATKQWKEVYSNQNEPDLIIIASPWHQKHLSSFYFTQQTEVFMIDAYMETKLWKYQIERISKSDGIEKLWDTFNTFFNTNINEVNDIDNCSPFIIKIEELVVESISGGLDRSGNNNNFAVGELFDDNLLLNMFTGIEEVENDTIPLQDDISESYSGIVNKVDSVECIKITSENGNVIYLPTEMSIKVKKFNQNEIQSVSPYELKYQDVWIKVKEKKKRELFEEILKLASNTLLMKWINTNISELKLLVKEVWQKYYTPGKYNKHIYEEIKRDINLNGGSVQSHLTIANWLNGGLIRSKGNLNALAKISGNEQFKNKVNIIHKSIRELWGIHIKLGRSLGNLIEGQINQNIQINQKVEDSKWINLGQGIVIPIDDILNSIDIIKIISVDMDQIYFVNPIIVERIIDTTANEQFLKRGIIEYV